MWLLALVAIILGVISGVTEEAIIFTPLVWFVLAIALAVLNPVWPIVVPGTKRNAG